MSVSVAVLGAGAWGTVFSQILADAGNTVVMWARDPEVAEGINAGRNPRYALDLQLHPAISATTDPEQALHGATLVAVAIPSFSVRDTLTGLRHAIRPDATVLSLAKGMEAGTLRFMTEVINEAAGVSPGRIVALSGPNLSAEIAQKKFTATVAAGSDMERAGLVASYCHAPYFRPYVSGDVMGAEVGGVVKNIVAMAVGAAEGKQMGVNARASIITRGLAEMARFGIALGARVDSFLGLAGLGDLVATCSSPLSRNYSFGYRIGQGMSVAQAYEASAGVVEGARSVKAIWELAEKYKVDMPITRACVDVIDEGVPVDDVITELLSRPRSMDGIPTKLV
ncbi:MAG: NAD(P)H-dependent glycerol-3-phosphate dehydrogenase [Actinomycetaceae bacterium]|nr:NAD(P)H-dependent glycerol-3-phosphate dehydrogenase [Actinomycetaceae bacterium]